MYRVAAQLIKKCIFLFNLICEFVIGMYPKTNKQKNQLFFFGLELGR